MIAHIQAGDMAMYLIEIKNGYERYYRNTQNRDKGWIKQGRYGQDQFLLAMEDFTYAVSSMLEDVSDEYVKDNFEEPGHE